MRAAALSEYHRRKAKRENVTMVGDFAGLLFRALERRHSMKYTEERTHPEWVDLGGES